jgi:hypothetical protein
MVGACLTENMPAAANATGDRARAIGGNPTRVDRIEWLTIFEGADADATTRVAHEILSGEALARHGVSEPPVVGTYRFVYGIYRTPDG